jgi:cytochrome c
MRGKLGILMALAVLGAAGAVQAQGDAAKGERAFNKCKACHNLAEEKNRIGPHLVGIIGRPSASVEDFNYSDAMRQAELVWDDETLAQYLADPRGFIPGNKMAFAGLRNEQEIADLLAYLHEETGG